MTRAQQVEHAVTALREARLDEGGGFSSEAVTSMASATLIAPPASGKLTAPSEELPLSGTGDRRGEYRCKCGHELRVFGGGRHRMYFEPADARLEDPVMNRVCPACERGLPGKNPR